MPRSIVRDFDGYSCYDKMYDYQRHHRLAEWKDVLIIEQKFNWLLHIQFDNDGIYSSTNTPNYNYNNTLSHETALSQKYILDGISEDSIEWNDFDMALYEYCDIWAKLFNDNRFCLIIFAMMQWLEFIHAYLLILDSPRMEKTVEHLKYLLTNNNGMYNSLPFENIQSIPQEAQDIPIKRINQIHMRCKLVQELDSLPSIGYFTLICIFNMMHPLSQIGLTAAYRIVGVKIDNKSIDPELQTNEVNSILATIARKHGRILKCLFSIRIGMTFDKGRTLMRRKDGTLKEKLINWVIEMLFMLFMLLPVRVERINRIEFTLTRCYQNQNFFKTMTRVSN